MTKLVEYESLVDYVPLKEKVKTAQSLEEKITESQAYIDKEIRMFGDCDLYIHPGTGQLLWRSEVPLTEDKVIENLYKEWDKFELSEDEKVNYSSKIGSIIKKGPPRDKT